MILVIMGIYTLAIVFTIHKYESSIKQYRDSIQDYKRALNLAKGNDLSGISIQLKNQTLQNQVDKLKKEAKDHAQHMEYLSSANDLLQAQNKILTKHNTELLNGGVIQYESHTYKSNTYESPTYKETDKIIEL